MSALARDRALVRSGVTTLLLLAVTAVAAFSADSSEADHASSTIGLLAIDALPHGNTATSLGPIDGCASVGVGGLVTVDYLVNEVPTDRSLIAFEADILYNQKLLEVVGVENDFLLGAEGEFQPFEGLSDPLPDSDGVLRIVVLDTASETFPQANVESGPGVLSRITFRAKATGVSRISVGFHRQPALLYPLLQDTLNETIAVDRLGSASVVVGGECPKRLHDPRLRDLPPVDRLLHEPRAGVRD